MKDLTQGSITKALFQFAACLALLCVPAIGAVASHRIGVRVVNGRGEFYDTQTDTVFVPRGSNYIQLHFETQIDNNQSIYQHSTFNVGLYDAAKADADLARMQADGYNVVRVFLEGCCIGAIANVGGSLSTAYISNVADFLVRARNHQIFVMLTASDPPKSAEYDQLFFSNFGAQFQGEQLNYLTAGGLAANKKFWTDFMSSLVAQNAPTDFIFGYSLHNEASFDSTFPPFTLTTGTVTTVNGKSYDMADSAARQAMMDENLVYWIDQNRAVIRQFDPTALVTIGFFQDQKPHPSRIGDPRLIRAYPAVANSTADFVDLHLYPGLELNISEYADNFGMNGFIAKPVLMGEFGAFRFRYATDDDAGRALQQWQAASCAFNFSGWLLWTWDTRSQSDGDLFNAVEDNGRIETLLSPTFRTQPCSGLWFSAGALNFTSVIGRNTAVQTIVVGNSGTVTQTLGDVFTTGSFQVQTDCLQMLNPGQACSSTVQFPTRISAGTEVETLQFGQAAQVKLTGSAIDFTLSLVRPHRPPRSGGAGSNSFTVALYSSEALQSHVSCVPSSLHFTCHISEEHAAQPTSSRNFTVTVHRTWVSKRLLRSTVLLSPGKVTVSATILDETRTLEVPINFE